MLLRIEDTDRERNNTQAIEAIPQALQWLGLDYKVPFFLQSSSCEMHLKVAQKLLELGVAYKDSVETGYVVRFRIPKSKIVAFTDQIQGKISVKTDNLEDYALVRSDGTPTYMLASVADDNFAGMTHVIRGDDHLTNTAKQILMIESLGWTVPSYAHVPLIHSSDGKKLSKRLHASSIEEYRERGILSEALTNYLLRLGWSHADDEVISVEQALRWFKIDDVGVSPGRFDEKKLLYLNAVYMRRKPAKALWDLIAELADYYPDSVYSKCVKSATTDSTLVLNAIELLNGRIQRLEELASSLIEMFLNRYPVYQISAPATNTKVTECLHAWDYPSDLSVEELEHSLRDQLKSHNLALKDVAQTLRWLLTGRKVSPGLFELCVVLGKSKVLDRIRNT